METSEPVRYVKVLVPLQSNSWTGCVDLADLSRWPCRAEYLELLYERKIRMGSGGNWLFTGCRGDTCRRGAGRIDPHHHSQDRPGTKRLFRARIVCVGIFSFWSCEQELDDVRISCALLSG